MPRMLPLLHGLLGLCLAAWLAGPGTAHGEAGNNALIKLQCQGALEMTFPNSQKAKRDMELATLTILLQPASGVASIERLPFGAYDFRRTFVFTGEGERLVFHARKHKDTYRQQADITLEPASGTLRIAERYEYIPNRTKDALMEGEYRCQSGEMRPLK